MSKFCGECGYEPPCIYGSCRNRATVATKSRDRSEPKQGSYFDAMAKLNERVAELEADLTKERADKTYKAKLFTRARRLLGAIACGLQDEGGRVYLNDTNEADLLAELAHDFDDLAWSKILADGKRRDLYAELRELRGKVDKLKAAVTLAIEQSNDRLGPRRLFDKPIILEDDNGEKLWIITDDAITALKAAIEKGADNAGAA